MGQNAEIDNANLENSEIARGDYREKWGHISYKYPILIDCDFIVFIDHENDLDWETSRDWDARGPKDRTKHNVILNEAALLEATPCDGLSSQIQLRYKRLIGEAIARSLHHDYVGARQMLVQSAKYYKDRSKELSRKWYLTSSITASAICMFIAIVLWLLRKIIFVWLGMDATWLLLSGAAGASGALLSVIGRSGKLHFDSSAGKDLHYLEGASRILAGGLSGFLAGLAVRSGVLLAALSRGGRQDGVMLLAAFAAGAGERLATSIISKVDSNGALAATITKHSDAVNEVTRE